MADFFDDSNNIDEEEEDIITLHNEVNDADEDYYHLATYDYKDKWYIVLKPVEDLPDIGPDEVLIFELVDAEGGTTFKAIEDEKLLDEVFEEFLRLTSDPECMGCCEDDCEHCHHLDDQEEN